MSCERDPPRISKLRRRKRVQLVQRRRGVGKQVRWRPFFGDAAVCIQHHDVRRVRYERDAMADQ